MFCYLVLVLFGLGWCDCYESLLFALRFFVLVVLGMVGFWLVCFWGLIVVVILVVIVVEVSFLEFVGVYEFGCSLEWWILCSWVCGLGQFWWVVLLWC